MTVNSAAPTAGTLQTGPCDGSEDLCNAVTISADEADSDPSNNSDDEPTDVTPQVDLSMAKVDLTDPVSPGGSLTYTLTVGNVGPSTATNVTVIDLLDTNTTYVSDTAAVCRVPWDPYL